MNNDYMDETGPYEPNPKNYREFSGYIYCKTVRSTYSVVSIVDGQLANMCTEGGRWYNICETHHEILQHKTVSLAHLYSSHPEEWCEKCKDFFSKLRQPPPKPRDSQRKKVYESERKIWPKSEQLETLPEINTWLDYKVFGSNWFEKSYPLVKGFKVHDGRAARFARGWFDVKQGTAHMKLPRWSRNKMVILHELAHGLCQSIYDRRKVAGHGKEWAGIFLQLLKRLCPVEYEALKIEYKSRKVKYEK